MLKQYQKPVLLIEIMETEDILTLSTTTTIAGIGDDIICIGFEDSEFWS